MASLRPCAAPVLAVLVGAAILATALEVESPVPEVEDTGVMRISSYQAAQGFRQAALSVDSTGHFYGTATLPRTVLEEEAHLSEPKDASAASFDASARAHVASRRGSGRGGAPSVAGSLVQWTFPASASNHHHGKALFVVVPFSVLEHVGGHGASNSEPEDWSKVEHGGFGRWFFFFASCSCLLLILVGRADSQLKVDMPPENERLEMVRGRSCWTWFCVATVFVGAAVVFILAFLEVVIQNINTLLHPEKATISDGEVNATVTVLQAENPAERAFEAGLGVMLSTVVCTMILFTYRKHSSVPISNALLAQFAFRGASLALVIAGGLEMGGSMLLANVKPAGVDIQDQYLKPGEKEPSAVAYVAFVSIFMLMVGVSEEFAKAVALAQGTQIDSSQITEPAGVFERCYRVLVESPHGLMLAGLSVGAGFMTVENAGYLISVVSTLPEQYEENGEKFQADSFTLRFVRLITIMIRVVLNLHPWLAGITAARLAQVVFGQSGRPSLTFRDILWAFFPSVLIHGAFDFFVASIPGMFAIFLPALFCFYCSAWFAQEWAQFDAAREPAVDTSAEPSLVPYRLRRKESTPMEGGDTEDTDANDASSASGSADDASLPADDPFLLGRGSASVTAL